MIKRFYKEKEGFYARKALLGSWRYYRRPMGNFALNYAVGLRLAAQAASTIETSADKPAIAGF